MSIRNAFCLFVFRDCENEGESMSRLTRRKFLRTLALSGTTACAASRLGLRINSCLATNPMSSVEGGLELLRR
jgi:hypothetical protein